MHQGLSSQHLDTVFKSIIVMRVAYATSAWRSFTNKEKQGQIDEFLKKITPFWLHSAPFHFCTDRERADRCLFASIVLLIQTIVFISFYLPPGQSIFTSGVEAIPTHCLLVRLICVRTVLLTDAYLVLFSFSSISFILCTVFRAMFLLSLSTVCNFVVQY